MADRIKFYMDEHVARAVTLGLRRRGVDVLTTQEANMLTAKDEEHLAFARTQERVIFNQDEDFLKLHAAGLHHAGIVYAHQQTSIGEIIRGLMLIVDVLIPDEMVDHVEYI